MVWVNRTVSAGLPVTPLGTTLGASWMPPPPVRHYKLTHCSGDGEPAGVKKADDAVILHGSVGRGVRTKADTCTLFTPRMQMKGDAITLSRRG